MKTVQNLISKSSQVCIAYILTLVRSVPWLIQCSGAGFGGFELISYQLYGDPTPGIYGQEVVDWGQYGFGSAAWKNMIGVFASAAAENGLNMDFALGPNQGAGGPVQDQTRIFHIQDAVQATGYFQTHPQVQQHWLLR